MTPSDTGFYRRPLPPDLVAFGSDEGRRLFREALAAGTLEGFFPLSEHFHTQAEPAWCGLGSLVVALNALAVDPGRVWKGPWRWFSEELLDCCKSLESVQADGLTLPEVACLARCNGAEARAVHADTSELAAFRVVIEQAVRSSSAPILLVNYTREVLGQTGTGHFSPVGGWHAERDLVLLLDVARFKYPPHWVPLERLWSALQPTDPVTRRSRGWLTLARAHARLPESRPDGLSDPLPAPVQDELARLAVLGVADAGAPGRCARR